MVPELAFLLVLAGMTCLALALTARVVIWTLPAGTAAVTAGGLFLATTEVSGHAVVLFALAGLCVGLELFALTGFGIHAAGAAVSALLAGLSVSGPPELHPVLAAPAAVAFGVGTFAAALTSWRRRRDLPFDTTPRLVGRGAILLAHPHPESQSEPVAVVGGQVWRISAVGAELPDGQFVRVVGVRDDRLVVRAVPATRGL